MKPTLEESLTAHLFSTTLPTTLPSTLSSASISADTHTQETEESDARTAFRAIHGAQSWATTTPTTTPIDVHTITRKQLQPQQLEITHHATQDTQNAGITTIKFHPRITKLYVSGTLQGIVNVADVEKNIQRIAIKGYPIHKLEFANNGEKIYIMGRRKHFYTMDLKTMQTTKISHLKNVSSFERIAVTNDSRMVAIAGKAGSINILDSKSDLCIGNIKVNAPITSLTFNKTNELLYVSQASGKIDKIDIASRKKVGSFEDVGAFEGSETMAAYGDFCASGGRNTVVNMYQDGKLRKEMMGLTTTVSGLEINPQGTLMAAFSKVKKDQLRMVMFRFYMQIHQN